MCESCNVCDAAILIIKQYSGIQIKLVIKHDGHIRSDIKGDKSGRCSGFLFYLPVGLFTGAAASVRVQRVNGRNRLIKPLYSCTTWLWFATTWSWVHKGLYWGSVMRSPLIGRGIILYILLFLFTSVRYPSSHYTLITREWKPTLCFSFPVDDLNCNTVR